MARPRRTLDHRLRGLARATGDVTITPRRRTVRSVTFGWLRRDDAKSLTTEPLSIREKELQAGVVRLQRRVQAFRAVVRLLVALLRAVGIELDWRRFPDVEANSRLLRRIDRLVPTRLR